MRIGTMSTAALLNRVKAIERAEGKDCLVKMAIFKSCAQDEGEMEIANCAEEALHRLMFGVDKGNKVAIAQAVSSMDDGGEVRVEEKA